MGNQADLRFGLRLLRFLFGNSGARRRVSKVRNPPLCVPPWSLQSSVQERTQNNGRGDREGHSADMVLEVSLGLRSVACTEPRLRGKPQATADKQRQSETQRTDAECAGRNHENLEGSRRR